MGTIEKMADGVKMVEVKWRGKADPRKGKPYLAIITRGQNGKKYDYEFLKCEYLYHKKEVEVIYEGMLPVGTVLRGREAASWKNDYSYFYVVKEDGLWRVPEEKVMRLLGILKEEVINE